MMSIVEKIALSAAALALGAAVIAGPALARGGGPGAFTGAGGVSHSGGFSHPGGFAPGFSHSGSFVHAPTDSFSHPHIFGYHPAINDQLHGQVTPGAGALTHQEIFHHQEGLREGWRHGAEWRYGHGFRYWWYGGPVWWSATDECPYSAGGCMQCVPIYDGAGNVIGWQLENVC